MSELSLRIPPNVAPGVLADDNICCPPDDDDDDDDACASKLGIKPSGEALNILAIDAPKLSAAVPMHMLYTELGSLPIPLATKPNVASSAPAVAPDDDADDRYAANADPSVAKDTAV